MSVLRSTRSKSLWALALILGTASCVRNASAQEITLYVVDMDDATPVGWATITLLAPDETSVWSGAADDLGRIVFTPPEPGDYYIVAEQLGFEPYRSPLLGIPEQGTYTLEIPLAASPVPIQGVSVSVEQQATDLVAGIGLTLADLGNRWIDRSDIERVKMPFHPGDVLRGQNVPGLTVDENLAGSRNAREESKLCVRLGRGSQSLRVSPSRGAVGGEDCAIVVVEGSIVDLGHAILLDPESFRAIVVLRPVEARFLYGDAGQHGAVVIWLGRDPN